MQELDKFGFKINVIPNGLEIYISLNINNKLVLVNGFQFLSSALDSLVKNLYKDDFKYLKSGIRFIKQKGFYPYEYMGGVKTLQEKLPNKEKFYTLLRVIKSVIKSMNIGITLKGLG